MTHRALHLTRIAACVVLACAVAVGLPAEARADETEGPTLREALARRPDWTAGVVLERNLENFQRSAVDEQLLGLSLTYFAAGRYGIHSRLMISPNVADVVDTRGVAAVGFRLRQKLFGIDTYLGAGAHVEARLRTHYWLGYVAPVELGVTAWERGSFRVEVFVGVRAAVYGELIDYYLVDPNGVDDAQASADLAARRSRPWTGYLSIVLARVM